MVKVSSLPTLVNTSVTSSDAAALSTIVGLVSQPWRSTTTECTLIRISCTSHLPSRAHDIPGPLFLETNLIWEGNFASVTNWEKKLTCVLQEHRLAFFFAIYDAFHAMFGRTFFWRLQHVLAPFIYMNRLLCDDPICLGTSWLLFFLMQVLWKVSQWMWKLTAIFGVGCQQGVVIYSAAPQEAWMDLDPVLPESGNW